MKVYVLTWIKCGVLHKIAVVENQFMAIRKNSEWYKNPDYRNTEDDKIDWKEVKIETEKQ